MSEFEFAKAAPTLQYQHYIPQFILKRFADADVDKKGKAAESLGSIDSSRSHRSHSHGILHVYDKASGQFELREVRRFCGRNNLYHDADDKDPMRIESLFSKLESKTSDVMARISNAVSEGCAHVDILEKDIHVLFSFMNLSLRRTASHRDEISDPNGQNSYMFHRLFEAEKKSGRSPDPAHFWRHALLYLLQTSHDDIIADAGQPDAYAAAATYKAFVDRYAIQIWKAADGHEFLLNDGLVDFEGDTTFRLGTEVRDTSRRLMTMTTDEMNHIILPMSPEVAIVFCDESRCWESPFADIMHGLKIPFPANSLLKNAPHKDVVNIERVKRRGKKWLPETVWQLSIGTLSAQDHFIVTSYCLMHAKNFVIARREEMFERASRRAEAFRRERKETWITQGYNVSSGANSRKLKEENGTSEEELERYVDSCLSALKDVWITASTTNEPQTRTKENASKSRLAIQACEMIGRTQDSATDSVRVSDDRLCPPFLKEAFDAAYPPQSSNHQERPVTMDFSIFFRDFIGDETFAKLSVMISEKIIELLHTHVETHVGADVPTSEAPREAGVSMSDLEHEKEVRRIQEGPYFRSVLRAAQVLDILEWMYKYRQDILATFVHEIGIPARDFHPSVTRIRARRI